MNDDQQCVTRAEIFRGHIDECIEHLSQCIDAHAQKPREKAVARRPIADFCKVADNTVKGWMEGSLPVGQAKIRLMCLLDMFGYYVLELEKLRGKKSLSEIIGYGLLNAQEVADVLKFSSTQHLFGVIFGIEGTSPAREDAILNFVASKKVELAQKKENARRTCRLNFSLTDFAQHKKKSVIISVMDGLNALLSSEIGDVFKGDLKDLSSSEKKIFIRLSRNVEDIFQLMAQCQAGEVSDG